MTSKEIVALSGISIMIVVGTILYIRQRTSNTTQIDLGPLFEDSTNILPKEQELTISKKDSTKDSDPQKSTIKTIPIERPLMIFAEQEASEEGPEIKALKILTWNPEQEEAPKETTEINGNVLETSIQENNAIRITTSKGLEPNNHAFISPDGTTIEDGIVPSQGNFVVVQTTPQGDKAATLELDPRDGIVLALHTKEESKTLRPENLQTSDNTVWTHLTPFGFSKDGSILYILAEKRTKDETEDTGLYAYNIETSTATEFFREKPTNGKLGIKLIKNNHLSDTLILERTKGDTVTIQEYNPSTREYKLLIPNSTLNGNILESPHLIAPDATHIILFNESTKKYTIYNTNTETATTWKGEMKPVGWFSNGTIIATSASTLILTDLQQTIVQQRQLQPLATGVSRKILGIFPTQ